MDLQDCLKKTTNKIIPVESNGRKFKLLNPLQYEISKISADKCQAFLSKKKCDYIFEIGCIAFIIYVELKGADLNKACEQLSSTIDICRKRHAGNKLFCYIICSRYPRFSTKQQNIELAFWKKKRIKLIIKCDYLEYNLTSNSQ